ncbi:MAG: penicillin acylase family protein, partial [Burkholderiales bacterium]|nr:penicillin acylase family protein [Anaerolineae bacterium]
TAFAFSRSQNAGIGSNNWVVSGDLTESGLPLLADDPHLGIQMPSIWYEIGLHCQPVSDECPFNVVGFALSPAPAVIVGHNDHIAWGVTNFEGDVQDLYQIRVNPDNLLQYEWNGEWRDMTVYDEEIAFGDSDETVTIQVRETHFGPIINDNQIDEETGELLGFNNDNPLALRWTALDPGTLFKGVLELNRAANWSEFRQALSQWDVPAQNFIYADTEGNIGYQVPGRIPYRATDHDGTLPVPGWTDEYEWQGFVPYDLMPRIFNPERGYIVTANQAVAPLEYYDHLAAELGEGPNYNFGDGVWDFGYRGQRINQLIETSGPHNDQTFRAIQGDNMNISASEIVPLLSGLTLDGDIASARDWLLEWDFYNSRDSGQAAFYANFWERLMANLYDDQLHDGYEAPNGARIMWATYLLMQEPDNAWWDDAHTAAVVESRDDILIRSLTEGYANTTTQLGTDRTQWRWGALHTAIFRSNPLGYSGIDLIENMVNRGPTEVGGGDAIVNSTGWDTSNPTFEVDWLPSLRMIVSVVDFERSFAINTTGQSGHPFSSNYGDMIPQWAVVNYHPMIWSREAVDTAAEARLILRPES